MAQVKYLSRRVLKSGKIKYVVNPPDYVKHALKDTEIEIGSTVYKVEYHQFEVNEYEKARAVACSISDKYIDHKRKDKRKVYIQEDSVYGLVAAYKKTAAWDNLAVNSKKYYKFVLNRTLTLHIGNSRNVFGDMLSRNITVAQAEELIAQIKKNTSPHAANAACSILRKTWNVGDRLGYVKTCPFKNMGLRATADRTFVWTEEQVFKFIDTADEMGMRSIGTLALLCYDLCQRPGDMRQLTWANLGPDPENQNEQLFSFEQEKTKTWVEIPPSPRLKERLENAQASSNWHDCILYNENTGQPYIRQHMHKVSAIRSAANIPKHLQLRDLRRSGATEMAEAGCTNSELRSVTGHKTMDVLAIYVRKTPKLAGAAVNKRFAKQVPATQEGAVQ